MTIRPLLVAVLLLLATAQGTAQAAGRALWDGTARPTAARHAGNPVAVAPERFRALTLDQPGLRDLLRGAPAVVALPAPGGGFERFMVRPAPVMAPGLAARHPEIRTYSGRGVDEPRDTVHLDLTPAGFHASVRGPEGTWYVDPYYRNDPSVYASYHGRDLPRDQDFAEGPVVAPEPLGRLTAVQVPGAPVTLRTYRLALLTDPTYAAFHGPQNVVAAKVTLVNRVNQVYEDDLGIRLQLIDADLELDEPKDMTLAGGPCGAAACFTADEAQACSSSTLTRTRLVLGQLAGAERFDVGHLALGTNGGGLASLGVVGRDAKAQGCTGIPTPVGDQFAIDYVAHEIGHQFAGNHTFNGVTDNCAGATRNAATSVEPGSGSSVMAYAGICGADDLQPHSDPYFSQRSLREVDAYVASAQNAVREVQNVALRAFDEADAFRLTSGGATSATITRGATYTPRTIAAAVEAVTGSTVTVEGFGGGTLTDTGFQVTFPADGTDHPRLGVTPVSGTFEADSGTTAQGGPAGNGGTATTEGNRAPVVTAPADATIPVRTPFRLVGSATDPDGDALTYSWEQDDPGGTTGTALFSQPKAAGPLFRQFSTAGAGVTRAEALRDFPDLAQVAAGRTNAATGTCRAADVECFSEFLPTAAYGGTTPRLHFRLTARDGRLPAGGVASDDVTLGLAAAAGPFAVTAPNGARTLAAGTAVPVTWDVAGTSAAPVAATTVEIRLSTDGGLTFPHVLAASTPNDGAQTVSLPAGVTSTRGRIQVASLPPAGLQRVVFFDVSDADLAISDTPAPVVSVIPGSATVAYTDAYVTPPAIAAADRDTAAAQLTATAAGLPQGLSLSSSGPATWTIAGRADTEPGRYPVTVTVSDGEGHQGAAGFAVVVAPEAATVAYTGETTHEAQPDATSAIVRLAAVVAEDEAGDDTRGDLTTATVTFRRDGLTLCAAPAAADGSASCAAALPQGSTGVEVAVGGRYSGSATQVVTVTGGRVDGPSVTPGEPKGPGTPAASVARLAPDLGAVGRRLAVSPRGRLVLTVRCRKTSTGAAPDRCSGTVVVSAKVAGRRRAIADGTFATSPTSAARVRLELSRRARRALASGRLRARLTVAVLNPGGSPDVATKGLVLRRQRSGRRAAASALRWDASPRR